MKSIGNWIFANFETLNRMDGMESMNVGKSKCESVAPDSLYLDIELIDLQVA